MWFSNLFSLYYSVLTYFDKRCRNYNVHFHIQCHILLWFSSIPTVSACASMRFMGVRPLVVPLDRKLRLLSAGSPLHWECSRRDKRLPCEKPFMAHEVLTGVGYRWFCDCERVFSGAGCYSGAEESTKTVNSGWCALFAQQSKAPGQAPHSRIPRRSI